MRNQNNPGAEQNRTKGRARREFTISILSRRSSALRGEAVLPLARGRAGEGAATPPSPAPYEHSG